MGVYIKGMEMPKKCSECLLAELSPTGESLICDYMLSRVPWDERPFDCPLVPVPPHGRLIDADALMLQVDMHGTNKFGILDEDIRQFVNDVPTIIQAEEGET